MLKTLVYDDVFDLSRGYLHVTTWPVALNSFFELNDMEKNEDTLETIVEQFSSIGSTSGRYVRFPLRP